MILIVTDEVTKLVKMLPPVEEAVLQSNPEFAALYSTLSTVILNPDGTTKNDPSAKERQAVRKVCRPFIMIAWPSLLSCD